MKYLEIILVCLTAILSLILSINNWSKLNNSNRMIVATIVAFLLIIAVIQITEKTIENSEKKEEKKKRVLIENIEAKIGDFNFDGEPLKHFKIGAAEDGGFAALRDGVFYTDFYGELIRLSVKDNKLLVYVNIRDTSGNYIASINGDTWEVFSDDYEYNNDEGKAFELVTKGERKVYFQIEYKNNLASISGFLLNNKGEGYYMYYDSEGHNGYTGVLTPVNKGTDQNYLEEYPITKIFKYPRSKYYGIRID